MRIPLRRGLIASCLACACASAATAARAQGDPSAPIDPSLQSTPAGSAGKPATRQAPRPPLPPPPQPVRLPWARHIEIGLDLALVSRPASHGADGKPLDIRYEPALGLGFHARWEIFRWLRFSAYYVGASHDLWISPSAWCEEEEKKLAPPCVRGEVDNDDDPDNEPDDVAVDTITFGARLAPTLPMGERARSWISIGIGYGRFDFPKMWIPDSLRHYPVRERAMSFVEIPVGIGTSYDVIRNWLTIELEVTGAFALGQEGESVRSAQAIDARLPRLGRKVPIGGLPLIDASFVQMLGLSLVL